MEFSLFLVFFLPNLMRIVSPRKEIHTKRNKLLWRKVFSSLLFSLMITSGRISFPHETDWNKGNPNHQSNGERWSVFPISETRDSSIVIKDSCPFFFLQLVKSWLAGTHNLKVAVANTVHCAADHVQILHIRNKDPKFLILNFCESINGAIQMRNPSYNCLQ